MEAFVNAVARVTQSLSSVAVDGGALLVDSTGRIVASDCSVDGFGVSSDAVIAYRSYRATSFRNLEY